MCDVNYFPNELIFIIDNDNLKLLELIMNSNIPNINNKKNNEIIFKYSNIIDILSFLLDPNINNKYGIICNFSNDYLFIQKLKDIYKNIINVYILEVEKNDINAVIPSKNKTSDVGLDITIIKVYKVIDENTTWYDTGLKIRPPVGYYASIVPRSSFTKSGYIMVAAPCTIDPNYTGNLIISLTKHNNHNTLIDKINNILKLSWFTTPLIEKNEKSLTLPFKCCQLILKKQNYCIIKEVTNISQTKTLRNENGFGSTDI